MINLPLSIEGFYFDIIENPRPSDYEMGPLTCDLCECHTSYYVIMNSWNGLLICKSCLTSFIDSINRRMLDDIKKRALEHAVPGEKGTREND